MSDIPMFEPQPQAPRCVKSKKLLIKLLTFAVFPKSLRKNLRQRLAWWLHIGAQPYNPKCQKLLAQAQEAFFRQCGEIDYNRYQIISLGSDCLSRTLPTFWRLKPRKKDGEKGYPFDLSANNITGMVRNLQSDFADFYNGLTWSNAFNCFLNTRSGSYYFHEDDLTDTPESVDLFKQRFDKRIQNFREALKADKPLIFVFHYGEPICYSQPQEFEALYNQIKKMRGNKPMRWLVVDTSHTLKPEHPDVEYYIPDFLPKGYVWHTDACRFSAQGIRFEQELATKLYRLITTIA